MKTTSVAIAILILMLSAINESFGECDSETFVNEINAAWVASNYPLIKQAISNRLVECTNDILAKGLYFEYYFSVETDFALGQEKAAELIAAISNRVPDEVTEKREPLGVPIAVVQMATSSNYPTSSPARIEYLHKTYADAFPHLLIYQVLAGRVEAIENGTFIWGEGFVETEE